ncbi:hypothetical protein NKH18_42775 [Streptomyces sp. M10(2022)]
MDEVPFPRRGYLTGGGQQLRYQMAPAAAGDHRRFPRASYADERTQQSPRLRLQTGPVQGNNGLGDLVRRARDP